MGPVELPDPLEVAASITGVLEGLGVRYLLGGSLASSVHGEPRSTNDVDILVDFHGEHVGPFVEALRDDYYVSEPAVRAAVKSGHHFNVIHMNAAVKVDLFLASKRLLGCTICRPRRHAMPDSASSKQREWREEQWESWGCSPGVGDKAEA